MGVARCAFARNCAARGIALFLDFVGNHTALDHPWTREHPEFYVQGTAEDFERDPGSFYKIETPRGVFYPAYGRDPYFPPWDDVAQLNHFSPQMRAAQTGRFAHHCEPLRRRAVRHGHAAPHTKSSRRSGATCCTARARLQQEFWAKAHAAVPNLILLAEAYWGTESRLLDLGFSFVYDKGLYDAVRGIRMPDVHAQLAAPAAYQSRLARFLENHDEDRCAAVFGKDRRTSVGTLMGTLPGMRFYHQGEIEGASVRLPITLRIGADEPADPASTAFFTRLLRITRDDVFHRGEWNLLSVTPEGDDTAGNLVAYEWRSEKAWKVISINLAGSASQGRVHFGARALAAKDYVFYDELNDVRYIRSADELRSPGLFVRRDGFDAHLFSVSPA